MGSRLDQRLSPQAVQRRMPPSLSNTIQMAAPPPPTWSCCQCGAANLLANATRCPMPLCAHDKCPSCHEGPPSPRLGPPGSLFPSGQPRFISSYGPSSHYTYSTAINDCSTPRPMQPSQPSAAPRQYPLGAYPPPAPGLRRNNTHNSTSDGHPLTSAHGYSSVSASGYPPVSASGFTSNSRAAQYSNSGGMAGYTKSSFAPPPTNGGSGRNGSRPSVRGWWVCCQDGYENNPDLCPEMCAMGDHRKCPRCRVLR